MFPCFCRRQSFLRLLVVLAAADSLFLAFFVFDHSYIDAFQHAPPQWYNRDVLMPPPLLKERASTMDLS